MRRALRLGIAAGVAALAVAAPTQAQDRGDRPSSQQAATAVAHPSGVSVQLRARDDTLVITGTEGSDNVTLRLFSPGSNVLVVDTAGGGSGSVLSQQAMPRFLFDKIAIDMRGENDSVRIDEANGVFTDTEQTTMDGGAGDDTMTGGTGREVYLGGAGDDFVDGNRGDDLGVMGADDDTFRWDPGDGNDTIEGQEGFDTMLFNGAGGNDAVDMSANGPRLRFFRQPGNVTMDTNDVEKVFFQALGGTDSVVVNDLSGTDVLEVETDLATAIGGTTPDGQSDTITVGGTNGDDIAIVAGENGSASVFGLATRVDVTHADPALDRVIVNLLAGADIAEASSLEASGLRLTEIGDDGDDVLIGSEGDDTLDGGAGDDVLIGGPGADGITCGAGDDVAITDGADTVAADC
jgi:Ca2+-binding RTX toxin-like protein